MRNNIYEKKSNVVLVLAGVGNPKKKLLCFPFRNLKNKLFVDD